MLLPAIALAAIDTCINAARVTKLSERKLIYSAVSTSRQGLRFFLFFDAAIRETSSGVMTGYRALPLAKI
jgi:hypothetical protein